MALGVWVFFGWMVFVSATGVAFLIWAWRSGQFKNVEEAKYRMLEDREPEPWPNREKKSKKKKEGGTP
ncbi:MAG: cbb3-type cytochrome oxidase assembly protein [Anaerolineae bacterium]|jgi:cbb3-type cytochrome oxidase maturation protein